MANRFRQTRRTLGSLSFLAPNFVGFLAFLLVPVAASLVLAFTDWQMLTDKLPSLGVDNFVYLVGFNRAAPPPGGEALGPAATYGSLVGFFVLIAALIPAIVLLVRCWDRTDTLWRFAYRIGCFSVLLGLLVALIFEGRFTFTRAWAAKDPLFWKYFYNTLFLMIGIPLTMVFSLFLALAMNRAVRGIGVFRAIFFAPSVCVGVAIFMVWRVLYHADWGLINSVLAWIYIDGPDWLSDPAWSKPALILMTLWTTAGGYNMVLYLAGLQNIPLELYEAAKVDGAGRWSQLRHVTWPMLAPTTFFIFTISIISGFQGGFEAAFIMTKGGPAGSTKTLSYYIYETAYTGELRLGYGSAIAWVLFVLVLSMTLINWRFAGRAVTGN